MATSSVEKSCTILIHSDKPSSANEIKEALEGNDSEAKVLAMKKAVLMLLNGEQMPQLFITIVRYVLPSEDHQIQKLLLLYLEAIEKTDANGKLLAEMILICQNLRNNLNHPNEFIRGVALRFLCRIKEEELLEPLIPSILTNLEHRHSYVRRNAVLAVNSICKLPKGDLLLPDAPEMIEKLLRNEQDLSTKRNAFLMLTNHAHERAVKFLIENMEQLASWGEILQLSVLELIRKVCRVSPNEKGRYIKVILTLLTSTSTAVVYECAVTLVSLSNAPSAIRAAANCYCQLLVSQSDNNVKLIILDRLQELKDRHKEVMQDAVMDILRALASPNLDIRKKTLDIGMDLLTARNIDEVVMVLKKEVMKTQSKDFEKAGEYRQMLVAAIQVCADKFSDVAGSVVYLLMDFLSDSNTAAALDIVFFVRNITETHEKLRGPILERLRDIFSTVRASRVLCCALWILAEYSSSAEEISGALDVVKHSLGPTPFLGDSPEDGVEANGLSSAPASKARPAVLSDGTYATQTAVVETPIIAGATPSSPNLRAQLLVGDFFLGGVIAGTLTKLALKSRSLPGARPAAVNRSVAESMALIVAILRMGEAANSAFPMDNDSKARMLSCLQVLANPEPELVAIWLVECHTSFSRLTDEKQVRDAAEAQALGVALACQPDDLIDFAQLKSRRGLSAIEVEDAVADDLSRATGRAKSSPDAAAAGGRLNRVMQLTGFSDPIYAEAHVTVHQYDIVLDVLVVNRSNETVQNLCLELATMGDLKLVERPQNYTLMAGESKAVRANIKVSSTETGVIFGNIVYEGTGYAERSVVVLSDIHVDIMDYISPAYCADVQFRNMWAEFEWENKVAINTTISDVNKFLDHIITSTNMRCLTPPSALHGECGYLAANLYAKSAFGEDALVNLSVERMPEGKLAGFIRIRSKTQGIALSLGDKITLKQKG